LSKRGNRRMVKIDESWWIICVCLYQKGEYHGVDFQYSLKNEFYEIYLQKWYILRAILKIDTSGSFRNGHTHLSLIGQQWSLVRYDWLWPINSRKWLKIVKKDQKWLNIVNNYIVENSHK
jgi:hypothetical protein